MARLERLSDATFLAVLHNLNIQDYASLRLVSRATHQLTNQHVPHVSIRLSNSTSQQQLQQYCHATKNLRHVTTLHVHITDIVSAEVFDAALQLLSQRLYVTELHLLAVVCVESQLQSLAPVQHMLPQLHTLVIEGIAIPHLADDLFRLVVSSVASVDDGWQLQRLTLKAFWGTTATCDWSDALSVQMQLPMAFPNLQHLSLRMPRIDYPGAALFGYQSHEAADAAVSVVANLLFAALTCKELQTLKVSWLPDVWLPRKYIDKQQPAVSAAAEVAAVAAASAEMLATIKAGDDVQLLNLPTPSSAATSALFATLDSYGCWLLRHHALKELVIDTEGGWSMSWKQLEAQQQQHRATNVSGRGIEDSRRSDAHTMAELQAVEARWSATCASDTLEPPDTAHSNSSNSKPSLSSRFDAYIPWYTRRPAPSVAHQIRRLQLELHHDEIDEVAGLLRHRKSLTHLQVQMTKRRGPDAFPDASAAVAAIKAAAAVQGLQSLWLTFGDLELQQLPADLLLPLTAAAGGPGSCLTELYCTGSFTATSEYEPLWLRALQQLSGLKWLSLSHTDVGRGLGSAPTICKMSVDSLPNSLKEFHGDKLHLVSSASISNAAKDVAAVDELVGSSSSSRQPTGSPSSEPQCQLQCLHLTRCQLSSPSILASQQLHDLGIADYSSCSWSGGWAAAATAWPAVRRLSCNCLDDETDYSILALCGYEVPAGSSSSSQQAADGQQATHIGRVEAACVSINEALLGILTNFSCLERLYIRELPCLSAAVLQLIVQRQQLRIIKIRFTRRVQLVGLSPLLTAYSQTDDNSSSSSSGVQQLEAVQLWLRHQLPWASIIMEWSERVVIAATE